jgi:hypothetical protein
VRNSTDVTVVLDRSGSMHNIAADTVGGYNKFLEDQKALPGECVLSLVQFNTVVETQFTAVPIRNVAPLSDLTFVPAGGTALLDAIGRAVTETGYRLAALPEHRRPDKVLFVILTDGEENSSQRNLATGLHYWGQERIAELIKRQQEFYNWKFIFLAANQDAFKVGAAFGFQAVNTIRYGADSAGACGSYNAMSGTVSALRSTGELRDFTDAERVTSAGTTGAAWDSKTGTYADQAGFAGKAA